MAELDVSTTKELHDITTLLQSNARNKVKEAARRLNALVAQSDAAASAEGIIGTPTPEEAGIDRVEITPDGPTAAAAAQRQAAKDNPTAPQADDIPAVEVTPDAASATEAAKDQEATAHAVQDEKASAKEADDDKAAMSKTPRASQPKSSTRSQSAT